MEFLKKLDEIKNKYYEENDVHWIGQHLDSEASIQWCIVRDSISNFEDFVKLFPNKYWSSDRHELVQDNFEYRRFDFREKLSSVQYFEQKILEYKQLTPILEKL